MRFLFVYQDYVDKARNLVEALCVSEVVVIVVRKNEDYPSREELDLIGNNKPSAAVCQVVRTYKRNICGLVDVQLEAKTFREDDQRLKEWLLPTVAAAVVHPRPSEAFAVLDKCNDLIIARDALLQVDDIHERRWGFVHRACKILCRLSEGEYLGPMREWKAQFDVEFAANGRVNYCYQRVGGKQQKGPTSFWHLKDGDKTTADDAPRIYFNVHEIDNRRRVIISYAGPHPADGDYVALIDT